MHKLKNIICLGIKELQCLRYDTVLLIFIIWAFSVGIYAAATAATMDLNNAPVAVVDEDRSPLSNRIINAFYPPYFMPPPLISYTEVDAKMDRGYFTFIIVIPSGFERDLIAGKKPAIQVNVDATRMSQAFIGAGYIQNIVNDEINGYLLGYRGETKLPIDLKLRYKFNSNLEGSWFGSIMEIINNINMLAIILAGAAIIREREHGTLEHLLVMPLTPFEIMTAKIWSNALVIIVAVWFALYVVVKGLLGVPILGSIPLFMLGTAIYLFSATSLGILLGTVARSMPQLGLLLILVVLPLQLLSGAVTPQESMPPMVHAIMQMAPSTHFVTFAQAILYRGVGLNTVWPQFIAITVIGIVLFLFALSRFRKMIGNMHD